MERSDEIVISELMLDNALQKREIEHYRAELTKIRDACIEAYASLVSLPQTIYVEQYAKAMRVISQAADRALNSEEG